MQFNPIPIPITIIKVLNNHKTAQNIPKLQTYYSHTGDLNNKILL